MRRLFLLLGFFLVVSSGFVSAALVNYYDFEDGAGLTLSDNVSSNDFSMNGISWNSSVPSFNVSGSGGSYSGYFGGVVGDNGSTNTAFVTHDVDFSVCSWFMVSDATPGGYFLSMLDDSPRLKQDFLVQTESEELVVRKRTGNSSSDIDRVNHSIVDDVWYHFCFVFNASVGTSGGDPDYADGAMSLYVNGTLVDDSVSDETSNGWAMSEEVRIGSAVDTTEFQGNLDELMVYDAALNSTEVANIYNYGNVTAPAPVDPNATLVVRAKDINNASIISGLCARVENSSFNSSGCNSSGTTVTFPTVGFDFSIGLYNITAYSVGVGDGSTGTYASNSTLDYNFTNNVTVDVLVTPFTLNLTFLDEVNRSSLAGVDVSVSVIDSAGGVTNYNSTDGNLTLSGVFVPGMYTLRYTATGYGLRDYFFTLSEGDAINDLTLYLLLESTYTPGVVEVRDFDGSVVAGATVLMERYYGESSIPDDVQYGLTNDLGNAVFVAESVTAYYTFSVTVDGVSRFADENPELLVVESDGLFHKSIVLNRTATDEASENTGFSYVFSPVGSLVNGTSYDFEFFLNSSVWSVTSCTLQLFNSSGVVVGSDSAFCSAAGGDGSITFSVVDTGGYRLVASVVTSDFTNTYTQSYGVWVGSSGNFTLKTVADDISGFSGSGFGDFARFFFALLAIVGVTFALAGVTNLLNNPEEMLLLMFGMSLVFSYIGWLTLNIPAIPVPALQEWLVTIVLGLFTLFVGYRKIGVTN